MGDFSRNPETRLSDARAKHYIGVRLQQGVPILDADWNESEDLRRAELETLGAWFIGNGVPSGSDGFHIVANNQPNNFIIRRGLCMVGGRVAENAADVTYTTQPNFGNPALATPLPPLAAPPGNKQYIVYLDVWQREVQSAEDPLMVDVRIGVESTVRLKREWAVRVARVPEDLGSLASPPVGHLYYQIARIARTNSPNITEAMITDLRTTQLSVHQSIEVYDQTNTLVVDTLRFKTMLENTHKNVYAFLKYLTTQFNTPSMAMIYAEALGLQAASRLISAAEGGLAVLNAGKMGNNGAIEYLTQLYAAEDQFHITWRDVMMQIAGGISKKYFPYQNFTTRLGDLLHQPLVNGFVGLQTALAGRDLEAAVATQEEIARLFGAAAQVIARGSVLISLAKSPPGNLNSGQTVRFEFRVKSFTTLADTFTATILPQDGWQRRVVDSTGTPIPGNKILIGPQGSEATILVDVVVGNGSSGLQLRLASDSNPSELTQTSGLYNLTQGQPPPQGEDKIQFNLIPPFFNATLNQSTGVVNMSKSTTGSIVLRITNATGQAATFTLSRAVTNPVGTWTAEINGGTSVGPISNGASQDKAIDITTGSNADTMSLVITATSQGGNPFVGTITVPFKTT